MEHVTAPRLVSRFLAVLIITCGCCVTVRANWLCHQRGIKRGSKMPQVPGHADLDALRKRLRWNDRTTPRRMLETFYFAIYCYDLAPELITNAIDCLDYSAVGKEVGERNAALMAHELNSIATRQDIALYSVPDERDLAGGSYVLVDHDPIHIAVARQPDGRWRFDAQTVKQIGMMRLASASRPARDPGSSHEAGRRPHRPRGHDA